MITIVDYGTGNLGSIANMFKKVGVEACITRDPDAIGRASKLVLPGVGAFDAGMANLEAFGLIPVLQRRVLQDKVPILGLCLGLQLFTRSSAEGVRPGLGWLEAETVRFKFTAEHGDAKIPHMGWNRIRPRGAHPLFAELPADPKFYFVHSFHLVCANAHAAIATAEHGYAFECAAARENVMGVQFHPEKSHKYGMQLFRNFARL